MDIAEREIAVIGAGVVGLSTALCIQKTYPEIRVTIFADKFELDTLSSGAGGLYRPEPNMHHDPELIRKWCKNSFSHFLQILRSPEAKESGMQLMSGYFLSSLPSQSNNPLLQEFLPEYRKLNDTELELFPEKFKSGHFFTTIITDCRYYLPWMKSKFEKAGGIVVKKHVANLNEIPAKYFIVVNCAGLAGDKFVEDDMLVPIRGQTIKVKAPWIKSFYYGDGVYILPGVDYVTLGGVKDYGSWSMDVNPYQKQYLWDKCLEIVPSLKDAEFVSDWVGLRPHRPSVRVDACMVKHNGSYRMVINNYGHGAHGVTLSHGTACEVTQMIGKLLIKKSHTLAKL